MTSRERVLTAFEHKKPDRVPAWCGASPDFWEKARQELGLDDEELRLRFGDDFRWVFHKYVGSLSRTAPTCLTETVFGIKRDGVGYGQPLSHPLAEASLKEIHDYPWPDPTEVDASSMRADAEKYRGEYAIFGGQWSPFFHDVIDMFGMENLYFKMYDEPELVDAAIQHIVDFYAESTTRIFDATGDVIDILFMGNDFGSQTGPMLGVELFDRFILPHLRRLSDIGHSYGLKTMLHCCGGIAPLIPSLIESGLDGLHAIQTTCQGMDLAKLKADFGDKILFNGGIDSHHVLIEGTPELVREETQHVLEIMMPGGGYVAGATHDYILGETPVENVVAMFDAIREYGSYS